ncbi:MAG TPA: DinB family protein [Bacillales bacterium]|nr:DinB family protein [Bacillales bacterium]
MTHDARNFYEYHVWANKRVFAKVKELPENTWREEMQSVFPTIETALIHIYSTDVMWLAVMRGDSMEEIQKVIAKANEETENLSLTELEEKYEAAAEQYRAFLDGKDDLDEPAEPVHPAFGKLTTRLSELVRHVVNHGTYHRGNITAMMRQLGHAGASSDYVYFLYEQQL